MNSWAKRVLSTLLIEGGNRSSTIRGSVAGEAILGCEVKSIGWSCVAGEQAQLVIHCKDPAAEQVKWRENGIERVVLQVELPIEQVSFTQFSE